MVIRMAATEAKAKMLALLDRVAAGEEIEITRHGKTVARLVPATGAHSLRGRFEGIAMTTSEEEGLFSTDAAWNLS